MQNLKAFLLCCLVGTAVYGQFLQDTENVQSFQGFFDFHYAEDSGKIYLEVEELDQDFLYVHALRTGLGSNDIGLDRGQLGGERLVRFTRAGNKLLLVEPNQKYRALTANERERQSVSEAFARSVLYGFEIVERAEGRYLIDLTPFLMEDRHGVVDRLRRGGNGAYKLDKSRSAVWMERTASFPHNSEFEAMITFTGVPEGARLPSVAPDARSVSIIQHFGFVKLPDPGYRERAFDPRCGAFPFTYMDYSSQVWKPLKKRLITRHRLEKKDPTLPLSEAVEPIVYYLDPGTPEPVRSALLEGGRWWNQAFSAIGYKNAFQVKMLPDGADPLDVRYNVIQWVHRSTRGWSYGATITDPRTGEIIKGHVSLGSLRIRQDLAIAQALLESPYATNAPQAHQPMLDLALARIRQLSAHEIGHTLGFAHNYASSAQDRASVMDYPHPLLTLREGKLDLANAYDSGIGEWDKVSVAYSYGDIPANVSDKTYLNGLLEEAYLRGLRFITDADARPKGSAHPQAHLWDNGSDAIVELEKLMAIRSHAIKNFSLDNIPVGHTYSELEDLFVPLYFLHRYQTEAAVKLIAGMDYDYLVRGSVGKQPDFVTASQQRAALEAILGTLEAENLAIPKRLLQLFPPRAFGFDRSRESFKSQSGAVFDPLAASATAADMSLGLLLHHERVNRLVLQKSLQPGNLGLQDLLELLESRIFNRASPDAYIMEIQRSLRFVAFDHLLGLLAHPETLPQARALIRLTVDNILEMGRKRDPYAQELRKRFEGFEKAPDKFVRFKPARIPDGSPIGTPCLFYVEHEK